MWVALVFRECRGGFLEGNEIAMRGRSGYRKGNVNCQWRGNKGRENEGFVGMLILFNFLFYLIQKS